MMETYTHRHMCKSCTHTEGWQQPCFIGATPASRFSAPRLCWALCRLISKRSLESPRSAGLDASSLGPRPLSSHLWLPASHLLSPSLLRKIDPFTYLLVISTASSVCWLLMPFAFILYFLMTYGSFLCILDISPFSVLKLASNFQVISPNLLTVNHVCGVL